MIRMARPFKDPRTGIFYFRRVVPQPLRPFFDGGATEYKRSLDTRDIEEAKARYPAHAVIYEQKLAAARRALLNNHVGSARAWVDSWLGERDDAWLRRTAMKLAMLETGAFTEALGLAPASSASRYDFGSPPSADDLRDHRSRKRMLEAVSDFQPLPWLETLQRIAALPSMQPIDWAITTIAKSAGVDAPAGSELSDAIGRAFLDRLCSACAVKVEPSRTRIIPASVIVAPGIVPIAPTDASASAAAPAEVLPTITEVFADWTTHAPRERKLVDEWRLAIMRFVALYGDLPVDQITSKMVRGFRRTLAKLPSRAPKDVASLPLLEQVELAAAESLPTLAPDTVNKALSAVRVMLEHAKEELELIEENVARDVRSLARNTINDARLPFNREDMKTIFAAPLPSKEGVPTDALAWILMLAPFTGCRLSELGLLRPGNIRREDGINFIAIEPDRQRVREESEDAPKRVKTASAKRDIPIHPLLVEAGFLDLVERRRAGGGGLAVPQPAYEQVRQQNLTGVSRDQRLS